MSLLVNRFFRSGRSLTNHPAHPPKSAGVFFWEKGILVDTIHKQRNRDLYG